MEKYLAELFEERSTYKEYDGFLFEFEEGEGRRFCFLCVVPLMIGLSMYDRERYNQFIQGKDGKPLID